MHNRHKIGCCNALTVEDMDTPPPLTRLHRFEVVQSHMQVRLRHRFLNRPCRARLPGTGRPVEDNDGARLHASAYSVLWARTSIVWHSVELALEVGVDCCHGLVC